MREHSTRPLTSQAPRHHRDVRCRADPCGAALEDLNWYVVDNLPPASSSRSTTMMRAGDGVSRLAAVVDVRSGKFFNEMVSVIDQIRQTGMEYRIIFLEAVDASSYGASRPSGGPHPSRVMVASSTASLPSARFYRRSRTGPTS